MRQRISLSEFMLMLIQKGKKNKRNNQGISVNEVKYS